MLRAFLLLGLLCAVCANAAVSSAPTQWKGGNGNWNDGAKWSAGLPTTFGEAIIGGVSDVVIPPGDFTTAALRVGTGAGDRANVEVNGANLLIRQDSLIVGKFTGGVAQFVLNGGSVESAMDIFVGGATASTGRMNRSSLVIKDGRLIGLSLTAGEGLGSDSSVEIVGSRSRAISALEFVEMLAFSDPGGKPATTTLAFTLDAQGVTPIAIQSRWQGLRISHDSRSHCRLSIRLDAVPPRDDITLISSRSPTQGIFDILPEGSEIAAEYNRHLYHWRLTYQGGESGHDLVLANRSTYPPGAPVTHTLAPRPAPVPQWWGHPVYPLAVGAGRAAFPGAQGYGASAAGGRGGQKIYVTNLNDSGTGSLRSAVTASGPRIVVFRRNDPSIRYDAGDGEYALYFLDGAHDDLADHLSLSWATNKVLSITKLSDRVTVQWCILSESLNIGGHGYASLAGGNRVTWHHNLFAHNFSRNPRFQGAVDADFRNNVVYDWGEKSTYGEFDRLNFVGNYFKPGPSTVQRPLLFHEGLAFVAPGSLYLNGNILEGDGKVSADNWKGSSFYFDRKRIAAPAPFPAPTLTNDTALEAFHKVLAEAGATRPHRDAVDNRIVHEVMDRRGRIIESISRSGRVA